MRLYTWSRRYPVGVSMSGLLALALWTLAAPLLFVGAIIWGVARTAWEPWFKVLFVIWLGFMILWLGH